MALTLKTLQTVSEWMDFLTPDWAEKRGFSNAVAVTKCVVNMDGSVRFVPL